MLGTLFRTSHYPPGWEDDPSLGTPALCPGQLMAGLLLRFEPCLKPQSTSCFISTHQTPGPVSSVPLSTGSSSCCRPSASPDLSCPPGSKLFGLRAPTTRAQPNSAELDWPPPRTQAPQVPEHALPSPVPHAPSCGTFFLIDTCCSTRHIGHHLAQSPCSGNGVPRS